MCREGGGGGERELEGSRNLQLSSFAGQEDYDAFVEVAAMDPATVAKELEEASNIKDLEARYVYCMSCNEVTSQG